MRTSINNLIIKTCSDTGRALIQLLTYYINDGDLVEETQQPESAQSSPGGVMEDELIRLEMEEHSLSKSQQDQISEMLVDAMEESPKNSKCKLLTTVKVVANTYLVITMLATVKFFFR